MLRDELWNIDLLGAYSDGSALSGLHAEDQASCCRDKKGCEGTARVCQCVCVSVRVLGPPILAPEIC